MGINTNAGSIVNTTVVYSDLPDLNPADNQATFNLVVNDPNLEDIPADGSNGLPYEFPDIEPPNNPPNNPPNQPPNNPPTPPTPPGPTPPSPGPGPGSSSFSNTQLARDIRYVRDYVGYNPTESSDEGEIRQPPQMPGWNVTPAESEPDEKSNEEWQSFLMKFAGDVAIYMILSAIPNEYLQQVGDAFVNSFSVLGNVARYFGYGKQVDKIAELWKKSKSVINNPAYESLINKWSESVGILDFNVGMKLLEKFLIRMFPNAEKEVNVLMATISTANLVNEPLGSIDTITNIMLSISKGNMPNPEDLIKFF